MSNSGRLALGVGAGKHQQLLTVSGQELSGGADTLRDETSDMDQQMTERIDEAMADFLPSDFTLVSFADPRNTGIERVQFVYLVDAQTEPAPEPELPTPAHGTPQQGD